MGEWELDPNDPHDAIDADGDDIPDALEDRCGGDDSDDRDGDGIDDDDEGLVHSDSDGDPDFCDLDSDAYGWPDADEGDDDADDDGTPDFQDADSDDDGISDAQETDADHDCDGLAERVDPWHQDGPCGDPDGDGWINGKEAECGTDPLDATSFPDDLDDCFGTDSGDPEQQAPPPSFTDGHFGGGCHAAPAAGAWLLGLAALLALPRRRRAAPWVLLLAAAATPRALQAQDLDIQGFLPAPDQGVFIGLEDAVHTPEGLGVAAGFGYAQSPFVYHYDDPDRSPEQVVASLGTIDLQPWWRIGPARVGLHAPLPIVASGSGVDGAHWIGDLALDAKLLLLDRMKHPVGLALRARATAPTGNPEAWVGMGTPTWAAELDLAAGERVVVAANAGVVTGNGTLLDDLVIGPRLRWGAGLRAPLTDPLTMVLELRGAHMLQSMDAVGAHPMEALLGIRSRPVGHWVGSIALGSGLSKGVGAPGLRLVTGLAFVPRAPDAPPGLFVDGDRDGLVDEHDACPDQAEDFDGRSDRDGCPDAGMAPVRVQLQDAHGQPLPGGSVALLSGDRREDSWRITDGELVRALPAGVQRLEISALGYQDLRFELELAEGRAHSVVARPPERSGGGRVRVDDNGGGDPDGDGLRGDRDACPDQPEDPNEIDDEDGCPDGYLTTTRFALTDAAGAALPTAQLMLVSGPLTGAWTAPDGALERSLVPGSYLLVARAEGYLALEHSLEVPEAAEHSVELTMEPAAALARLELQVQDASGAPIPARAWAQGPLELLRSTDDDGFLPLALPAGAYQLHISSPGFRAHHGGVELEPDTTTPLLLVLDPLLAAAGDDGVPRLRPRTIAFEGRELGPDQELALQALADSLRAHPELLLVTVAGWVTPQDHPAGATARSLAQATAARDWLVEHEGIDAARLIAVGLGALEPAEGEDRPPRGVELSPALIAQETGASMRVDRPLGLGAHPGL